MNFEPIDPDKLGVLDASELASMSGLEFFQKLRDGLAPGAPIAGHIPMQVVDVAYGELTWLAQPDQSHFNPIGTIHGGFALTVLDTVAACSVHTTLEPGEAYTSVEIKTNFVRPILPSSGPLVGYGKILSRGSRTGTAEAKLYDNKDRLVAFATTTCMIWKV